VAQTEETKKMEITRFQDGERTRFQYGPRLTEKPENEEKKAGKRSKNKCHRRDQKLKRRGVLGPLVKDNNLGTNLTLYTKIGKLTPVETKLRKNLLEEKLKLLGAICEGRMKKGGEGAIV